MRAEPGSMPRTPGGVIRFDCTGPAGSPRRRSTGLERWSRRPSGPGPRRWFHQLGVQSATAAIAGLAKGRRRVGTRIVTSAVDHSSVLAAAEDLRRTGDRSG